MHPILASFSIGGTHVVLHSYATFYVLAWVVAVALGTVAAHRSGIAWPRALLTFVVALVAGIVGARLLDLAVNWAYYAADPSRMYQPTFGGFSLYGGLILGLAAGAGLARLLRLEVWRLGDSAVPALAAGIVFMRIGCFLNGCCFGKVTSLPWGVTFPYGSPAWTHQLLTNPSVILGFLARTQPVHPTQIYEIIAATVLGGLATWLVVRKRLPSGAPLVIFLLGFTLFRLGNNYLRATLPTFKLPGWFFPVVYLVVCAVLAAVLAWRMRASPRIVPSTMGDATRGL